MANKVIKWLIIPFFAILLMSQNVSAIDTVIDLSNYDMAYFSRNPQYNCVYSDDTISTGYGCSINSSKDLISATSVNSYNLKIGDIVETYAMAYSGSTFTTGETASGYLSGNLYPSNFVASNKSDVLSFEPVVLHTDGEILNYYNYWNIRNAGTGQYVEGYPEITQGYQHYSVYKILIRVRNNFANAGEQFSLLGSASQPLFKMTPTYNSPNVVIYFPYFKVWRKVQTKEEEAADKDLESTENIENQSPSDTPGGDNQSATNLIGNISGIFNQIANIPVGSSCSIDADFGNLDLGNLNLCTGKDKMPFIVNFGATVFQLVFVVSTGLILVRQVLSLYDWSRK